MLGFVPQPNLHGLRFLGKTYAVLGLGVSPSPLASPLLPKGEAGAKGEEEQLCKTDPDQKRSALQRLGLKPPKFGKGSAERTYPNYIVVTLRKIDIRVVSMQGMRI
jgi:hypothetical protein